MDGLGDMKKPLVTNMAVFKKFQELCKCSYSVFYPMGVC